MSWRQLNDRRRTEIDGTMWIPNGPSSDISCYQPECGCTGNNGTTNTLAMFTSPTTVGNSVVVQQNAPINAISTSYGLYSDTYVKTNGNFINTSVNGGLNNTATGDTFIAQNNYGWFSNNGIQIYPGVSTNAPMLKIYSDAGQTNTQFQVGSVGPSAGIFMPNLPTSNPGVPGQVWNNGGVLNISL